MMDEVIFGIKEKLTSLSQPDLLLSHQYFAIYRRRLLEPETRLMLVVLEDAVACFQRYAFLRHRRERVLFNEAEGWICDERSGDLFSFEHICEVLKFNPKYLRGGLLRWKQNKLAQRQKFRLINIPSTAHETFMRKHDPGRIKRVKRPCPENKVARMG